MLSTEPVRVLRRLAVFTSLGFTAERYQATHREITFTGTRVVADLPLV